MAHVNESYSADSTQSIVASAARDDVEAEENGVLTPLEENGVLTPPTQVVAPRPSENGVLTPP